MPFNEVLYNVSYSNVRMYFEVLPSYNPKGKYDNNGKKKSSDNKDFKGLLSVLKTKVI